MTMSKTKQLAKLILTWDAKQCYKHKLVLVDLANREKNPMIRSSLNERIRMLDRAIDARLQVKPGQLVDLAGNVRDLPTYETMTKSPEPQP